MSDLISALNDPSSELLNHLGADIMSALHSAPEKQSEFDKRLTNFTASEYYRLVTDVDKSVEERIRLLSNKPKQELIDTLKAHNQEVDEKMTKADLAIEIFSISKSKDVFTTGAMTYVYEKLMEAVTGQFKKTYQSASMLRGKDEEQTQAERFMKETGYTLKKYGVDQKFESSEAGQGSSPDGEAWDGDTLIGGFEGKAPDSITHWYYLYGRKEFDPITNRLVVVQPPLTAANMRQIEPEYYWQCQGGMMDTGLKKWFWMSYDDRMQKESDQSLIFTLERNDHDIALLRKQLKLAKRFLEELKNQ